MDTVEKGHQDGGKIRDLGGHELHIGGPLRDVDDPNPVPTSFLYPAQVSPQFPSVEYLLWAGSPCPKLLLAMGIPSTGAFGIKKGP